LAAEVYDPEAPEAGADAPAPSSAAEPEGAAVVEAEAAEATGEEAATLSMNVRSYHSRCGWGNAPGDGLGVEDCGPSRSTQRSGSSGCGGEEGQEFCDQEGREMLPCRVDISDKIASGPSGSQGRCSHDSYAPHPRTTRCSAGAGSARTRPRFLVLHWPGTAVDLGCSQSGACDTPFTANSRPAEAAPAKSPPSQAATA
jgi:hypothetical protein